MLTKEQVANLFRDFSVNECKGSSPLYEYLSIKISEDEEVLTLASYARLFGQNIKKDWNYSIKQQRL
ncbi:hypothetical protein IEE_02389 [Bacillus cereus BAG5X1-1]|uniref:Uncharacterized protein n=1 Tax=Bacillus cereus BAG5X1-1 TaxID=1053189 RepID=J7XME4_BACCE|nr:hypothetical protein IEE_02389 [Bacillus cereus BAG5X1-1]